LSLTLQECHGARDGAVDPARIAARNALAVHVAFDVSGNEQRSLGFKDELLARNRDVLPEHRSRRLKAPSPLMPTRREKRLRRWLWRKRMWCDASDWFH